MKRVIFSAAATIAGLVALLNFKTQPATTAASSTAASGTSAASSSPATTAATSSDASSSASSGTATVTGTAASTRYGPVQVKVTVSNGKVTSVQAVEYPTDRPKDVQINSYAIPLLDKEAVAANSAKIDSISGATYTSTGFKTSLQSALNQAGIA
jgi:uncharacterized protein with FMN-binding domain